MAWYFVIFFFVAMVYFLAVPRRHRNLFFSLAILAGFAASLSEIQGFIVWPVGVISLLWASPWVRRTYYELGVWIALENLK